jgi:hypothetical protein
MSSELVACACGVALTALAFPDCSFAHAGRGAPVATNFEARIEGVTPPTDSLEAKVVDGDRQLWVRTRGDAVLVVPGAFGEPLLRFDRRGVSVNVRSMTAQTDRIDPLDLRPLADLRARPVWHRVTTAHAYRWHEHRLHALEALAGGHRSGVVGRWSVQLLVDGRRHDLAGVLVYRRPPRLWPIVLAIVLAVVSLCALGLSTRLIVPTALLAALLVWAVRVARGLHGRPDVETGGYADVTLTCLVGAGLVYGLLHRDANVRRFVVLLVGAGSLYEAWTMFPVLTHSVALTELPTTVARLAVATILGVGAALLAITAYEGNR